MPRAAPSHVPEPRKSDLSAARRRLVETMQAIGFGRIEGFLVRDAEPVWSPAPRIVRHVRLGTGDGASPSRPGDFSHRTEIVELLALFERERDLHVESIEVQYGLPVRVAVATEARS